MNAAERIKAGHFICQSILLHATRPVLDQRHAPVTIKPPAFTLAFASSLRLAAEIRLPAPHVRCLAVLLRFNLCKGVLDADSFAPPRGHRVSL